MNPQEKYKLIRTACIEANPEIMRLEFGCEVMIGLKKRRILDVLGVGEDGKTGFFIERFRNQIFNESEFSEILGRDIRLSDIFLAIAHKNSDMIMSPSFQQLGMGIIMPAPGSVRENTPPPNYCLWNLKQDSLRDNPQTWDFLAELLKE